MSDINPIDVMQAQMTEPVVRRWFTDTLADSIRVAVEAEREACAKVAEGDHNRDDFPWCGDVREIAAAIRARGNR